MEMEIGQRFITLRQRLDELNGLHTDVTLLIDCIELDGLKPTSGYIQWVSDEFNDLDPITYKLHIDNDIFPIHEIIKPYLQRIEAEILTTTELIKRL